MSWKLISAALGAALAASLLFPPSAASQKQGQDPTQEEIDRRRKEQADLNAYRRAGNVETLRRMQGGWQLTEFRSPSLEDAGREDAAFMVVSTEFLAIEIHMAYFDELGEEEESFLQTGTYRLNFNSYGDLTTTLLIGSQDVGDGVTMPQVPGQISVYEVEATEDSLTLLAEDSTRFIFRKMATGQLTLRVFEETEWLPRAKKGEQKGEDEEEKDELGGGDDDDQ